MTLQDTRRAIRHLLAERDPADGMAAYYAFHHNDQKTHLITYPESAGPREARGYVAISRTGLDLFRPLLTLRLPLAPDRTVDLGASGRLLAQALPPGAQAFLAAPVSYEPIIKAFFQIDKEDRLQTLRLDRSRFEPIINVLVTREDQNGLPRYVIKQEVNGRRTTVAAAGLNWMSPTFGEIAVRTWNDYRRQGYGKSVVAALTQHLLDSGRTPLYAVSESNLASLQLAQALGFVPTGIRELMLEVTANGHPRPPA